MSAGFLRMADQTQRLEVATVKAEVGSAILYRFANDAVDAAAIPTESGDIRNIKQVILDITTEAEGKLSFASTIYPTTAAGLAATQNGNIFLVRSSDPDEIYIVYENQNGTAVDTGKRALSGSAITAAVASATQAAEAAQDAAGDATSRVAGYHSPSATAPSTRDDGTALQIGDTYYNTAENQEYIYKQSGWAVRAIDGSYLSANEGAARVGTAGGTTVQAALNAINTEVDTKQEATAALGYLSSVTPAANQLPYFNTATGATTTSLTAFGRSLIDDSNAATARTTLGLGNVDNTSDANKPISTATQSALDLKAPINSPTFTGTVDGITKSMVGLSHVDNTSDANKPVSSATATELAKKTAIIDLAATTGAALVGRSGSGTLQDLFNATEALGSNILPYVPPGGSANGSQATTVQNRLARMKFVSDYDTTAHGLAVLPNIELRDPEGITYKNTANQQLAVFGMAASASWLASDVFRSTTTGTHPDVSRIAVAVELSPSGSGKNGPQSADYAMNLSNTKTNWATTTQTGEIDGLSVMLRQGGKMTGGIASDAAGILVNVGNVAGSGWIGAYESVTQNYADDGTGNTITRSVQNAIGVLDSVTSNYHGFTTTANAGALNAAYFANTGTGTWSAFLNYFSGGVNLFKVDGSGRIVLSDGSATNPTKMIRVLNGSLNILNHNQTVNLVTLSDSGAMNLASNLDTQGVIVVRAAAGSAGANTVVYGGTISTTATAGSITKPSAYSGYIIANINGTQVKIPYYAN